jgi:hypothetical protein
LDAAHEEASRRLSDRHSFPTSSVISFDYDQEHQQTQEDERNVRSERAPSEVFTARPTSP